MTEAPVRVREFRVNEQRPHGKITPSVSSTFTHNLGILFINHCGYAACL
jgi:hypothetical protein